MRPAPAFTLAELLIALAILGVIAVFTIPKVLNSQQDSKYKSITKEAAGTLSSAYLSYKQQNGDPPTGMVASDLSPFLNYVKYDTLTIIDSYQTGATASCPVSGCVRLHNGAMLLFWPGSFNGTAANNFIWFVLDPDGTNTNGGDTSASAAGKSVILVLYYNGRLVTRGTMDNPSVNSTSATWTPAPSFDPPWFSWN